MASTDSSTIVYPHVKDLINPTESEVEQTVAVLVDAFEEDPFSLIALGGNLELAYSELKANVKAALIGGQVHVITIGPALLDIVGVALWYPPGSGVFSTEEERSVGWNQFMDAVPTSLKNWWMEYFIPKVSKLSSDALGPEYSRNSWHLHLFGIMKKHQRKGYGKALFKLAEERAIAAGKPLVLETTTETNVEIYTKLGFHIVGKTDVVSPIVNTKADMGVMVKEHVLGKK